MSLRGIADIMEQAEAHDAVLKVQPPTLPHPHKAQIKRSRPAPSLFVRVVLKKMTQGLVDADVESNSQKWMSAERTNRDLTLYQRVVITIHDLKYTEVEGLNGRTDSYIWIYASLSSKKLSERHTRISKLVARHPPVISAPNHSRNLPRSCIELQRVKYWNRGESDIFLDEPLTQDPTYKSSASFRMLRHSYGDRGPMPEKAVRSSLALNPPSSPPSAFSSLVRLGLKTGYELICCEELIPAEWRFMGWGGSRCLPSTISQGCSTSGWSRWTTELHLRSSDPLRYALNIGPIVIGIVASQGIGGKNGTNRSVEQSLGRPMLSRGVHFA
ncbi:hypothetical protein BD410DRAFT_809441 [Rickenella mellea]|uniref:Uncharacterized protein n=1 Tax=Rickenella mellea TaxID=50990 RepID=A0A4Y7PK35_9AGAM|nr:hypothetical protein BD410DRAFT_809441 [Rickenella mellea]